MARLLFYKSMIQRIADTDGVSPEDRDRLLVIAARSKSGCSMEDAQCVAYLLYRMLLQPRLTH